MKWLHGNSRWIFLIVLIIVASIRVFSVSPKYKLGDLVKVEFVVSESKFHRHRDIWLKDYDQEVQYGDKILATGRLEERVIGGEAGGFWLVYDAIVVSPGNKGFSYQINALRHQAISRLISYLPKPEGALAAGLFLGGTDHMSRAQTEAYRRTGLTHLVAASGYNVALVVGWTSIFFSRLIGRRFLLPVVLLTAIGYMFMAGMTSAVVRAGLMSILVLVGGSLGRQADARWILILVTLGMLIWNPLYISDIGWQLSVAATAGLVYLAPKGNWWTTIAAQITTMPLILHYFGNLSVVAPLANIFVLALMPLTIQITALSLLLGLISPVLGQLAAWLAWPILKFTNEISLTMASLPFSSLSTQNMSWLWVLVYYLALIIWIALKQYGKVRH